MQGYQVQHFGNPDQTTIQMKKGGDFSALLGMQRALTLTMQRVQGGVNVVVGQEKWADKACAWPGFRVGAPLACAPTRKNRNSVYRALLLFRWRAGMTMNHPPVLPFIAVDIRRHGPQPEKLIILPYLDLFRHEGTDHARASLHHD